MLHHHIWHPARDSNPDQQFWRLTCCHYTSEIHLVLSRRIELLSIGYQPIALPLSYESIFGTEDWTRTNHTQIFSLLLYLMSYFGIQFSLGSHTRIELVITESQPVVLPLN